MKRITSVKFLNQYPEYVFQASKGMVLNHKVVPVDFKLGLGPCGKVVDALGVTESVACLTIHQTHTDGTSKSFLYQWDDICGRVQLEFE